MIENEDNATVPRPVTLDDVAASPATIQVPAVQTVTAAPANPYVTVDDLLALHIVGDPQLSPDGSLIAFTVHQCNAETNTTSSATWLVESKAGKTQAPRQLTNAELGKHHDVAPRWSPDGQFLAFLSDRCGSMQLYLLPLQGGEARTGERPQPGHHRVQLATG